jgi:hypothetical protein
MCALACVVLGTLGLLAIPASGARAGDIAVSLPITGFGQLVVDSANSHLFFSQGGGAGASSILVTDFSGNTVSTISEPDGVAGMALSPDGSTLYAALPAADAVDAISTSTLTEIPSYPLGLGTGNAPFSVAAQSGKVWVSYDTGTAGQSSIGEFDPAAMTPTFTTQAAPGTWNTAPLLASDPSDTGVLVAVEPGANPASAESYNTTTAVPVTARGQTASLGGTSNACANAADLAVSPGGAEFTAACDGWSGDFRFSTTDPALAQLGGYPSGAHANAAGIAATSGTTAAGTAATSGSDIFVYAGAGTTPLNVFGTGTSAPLAPRGLGLSANASALFAVTSGGGFMLHVYQQPAITRTALTLSGPATAVAGKTYSMTGTLTLGNLAKPPANATVIVTRTAPDNTQTQLSSVPVAPDGAYTVTDIPVAPGAYSYTANYGGDSSTAAATSAALAVTATLNTSSLTLTGPASALVGKALTLTGSLRLGNGVPLPPGSSVTITRTDPDKKKTQASVQPKSTGSFTVTDTPAEAGAYTYVASYAGNTSTGASTSLTVTVAARLNTATLKLSGTPVVTFGADVVLTGKLTFGVGSPAAGTPVTVIRNMSGGIASKTFHVKLTAGGGFTLADHAPAKGRYTYTALYAGNPATAKAMAAVMVTVARTTPALRLITSSPDYVFNTRITVTAALGATFADRTVSIYAKPAGSPVTLLKTGKVSASGDLSVSYVLPRNTVFSAVFAGDVHNAPVTVTRGVGAFVKIAMTNGGYFETVTIMGIKFRVYHHTGNLDTAVTVTPNKAGQCVELEVQQWFGAQFGWRHNTTAGCYKLDSSSQFSTFLTLLNAGPAEYRMRAEYVRSSGDNTNVNTNGAWFYFEVVK